VIIALALFLLLLLSLSLHHQSVPDDMELHVFLF
jgi:hypothetical protein